MRVVTTGPTLTLSHLSFDLLWSDLDRGPFPVVLQLTSHGLSFPEREALFAADRRHLQSLGVVARDGRPDTGVAGMLHALARPDIEVDARFNTLTDRLRVLAAARGATTVHAVRTDTTVTLTPVSAGSLAQSVVSAVPGHRPAPRAQLTGPTAAVDAALEQLHSPGDAGLRAMVGLGVDVESARVLVDGLQSVFGMTRIGAAVRDDRGHRQRHPFVVAMLDGSTGRWMSTQRAGTDRVPWTTIRQAGTDDFRAAVQAMIAPKAAGFLR